MTITAQECCTLIEEALEMFGRYSYCDKGPTEVMDFYAIMKRFNSMPAQDVKSVLLEVMKHPDGQPFVSAVLVSSQKRSDEDFEIMVEAYPNW